MEGAEVKLMLMAMVTWLSTKMASEAGIEVTMEFLMAENPFG